MPNAEVKSKEEFRKGWDSIERHGALIIDEIHHFSGKSQMMKSLLAYIKKHNPSFVWGASATPYRSTPWNVYYLAQIMGYQWSWLKFRDAFFKPRYFGPRMVYVPKEDAKTQTRLVNALKKFSDVVSAEDAGLPPEDVFEEEYFELTYEQKQAIGELKKVEANPVVRYGKEHQIAQGHLNGNEFEASVTFKSEKTARIVELAEEHRSLLIFAKYNGQIQEIAEVLRKKKHKVYVLTGATKNRQELIEKVAKEDHCILISNAALGEGWECPRFTKIIFASLPWGYAEWIQCLGRASRVNVPKRRTYAVFTVKNSVDEAVKEALDRKKDFNIELYAKT